MPDRVWFFDIAAITLIGLILIPGGGLADNVKDEASFN